MKNVAIMILLALACASTTALALSFHSKPSPKCRAASAQLDRRSFALLAPLVVLLPSQPSSALVKGVSPPPSLSAKKEKPNCKTIDECEALQEAKIAIERASMADIKVATVNGIKYVDLEEGTGSSVSSGSTIQVKFKVLKAGKRSYDGLSGEGTVVFSDGYGLEDNEKTNSFFEYQVSSVQTRTNVVETFIVGVEGMKEGGVRRVEVQPQKGWEKKTTECDGGPGGKGNGGDIKTDMMIVPTAKMVQEEMCFDKRLVPFPKSYAEERRMAQRFDQALILEIGILKVL